MPLGSKFVIVKRVNVNTLQILVRELVNKHLIFECFLRFKPTISQIQVAIKTQKRRKRKNAVIVID